MFAVVNGILFSAVIFKWTEGVFNCFEHELRTATTLDNAQLIPTARLRNEAKADLNEPLKSLTKDS